MEQIEQEIVKLSKYNSAALINLRLNNIWINVNRYATSGRYFQWNNELDRVWCELGGDVEEIKEDKEGKIKEPKEIKDFNKLDKDVSEKLKEIATKQGFSNPSTEDKVKITKTYHSLLKKEFFLRRLQNKQGKGTAYEQGWEDYLNS